MIKQIYSMMGMYWNHIKFWQNRVDKNLIKSQETIIYKCELILILYRVIQWNSTKIMNFVWNFHSKWKFVDIYQFTHDNFEFVKSQTVHPVCGKLKTHPTFWSIKLWKIKMHYMQKIVLFEKGWQEVELKSILGLKKFYIGINFWY